MKLLRDATTAERNAAFDAVFPILEKAITDLVPGFFQSNVRSHLESSEGKKAVLNVVDTALEAAEAQREKDEGPRT